MGNSPGPKSSQICSPFHYSRLCAGGSGEAPNWSPVRSWPDSHDCAFRSQTIWASSPHNSRLPAWARVEEHSVSFPSCFTTRCPEHCRTLARRGRGKKHKATHIQLQVENQQRLPRFCSGVREAGFCSKRGRKPSRCATKYGTKTRSVSRMGVFTHKWRVCTPHARNHTFKVIGEVY